MCLLPHHLTHGSRQLLWNYITAHSPPTPLRLIPPSPPQCVGCWRRAKHAGVRQRGALWRHPLLCRRPEGPLESQAACALVLHCITAGMLLLLLLLRDVSCVVVEVILIPSVLCGKPPRKVIEGHRGKKHALEWSKRNDHDEQKHIVLMLNSFVFLPAEQPGLLGLSLKTLREPNMFSPLFKASCKNIYTYIKIFATTDVTVPFVTSHHHLNPWKVKQAYPSHHLRRPEGKDGNYWQPWVALHHMTFKNTQLPNVEKHHAIKRLQSTKGFLSHTEARRKEDIGSTRRHSGKSVEWGKQIRPASGAPTCAERRRPTP